MSFTEIIKSMPNFIGSNGRTEKEISDAEKKLGTAFANDYRAYLKEIGLACFDGHEFTGLTNTLRLDVVAVTNSKREHSKAINSTWYVVEEAGIDDIVIWQSTSGTVYETIANSYSQKIANSLSEYISK